MTRFISIISGKGGVGKTTSTINIGHALAVQGTNVVVVDANLMTPNLGLHLGLVNPKGTLNHFLRKEKTVQEITHRHESGLSLIPASPSYKEYQKTNPEKVHRIFEHLDEKADIVLVDAPSGLGMDVQHVLKQSDEVLVVATPTLSSVMDALKSIEVAKAHNATIAGIILNMTHRGKHELSEEDVHEILGHRIIANIRRDKKVYKAGHRHMPVHYLYPRSHAAKKYREIAEYLTFQ